MAEAAANQARTHLSYGDLQRAFPDARGRPMTRAVLDRVLRDYARELPQPEVVGGARIWPADSIEVFRIVLARDRERRQ